MNINIAIGQQQPISMEQLELGSSSVAKTKPEQPLELPNNEHRKQENSEKDFSELVEELANSDNPYTAIFKHDEYDFSSMSINEFHDLVKTVNDMDWKFTQQEVHSEGYSGNGIMTREQSQMIHLQTSLWIISQGGGGVDPDEKIDVREHYSNLLDNSIELAEKYPQQYSQAPSFMSEILSAVDEFISQEGFEVYQRKAITLLNEKSGVDINA